ncbi:MAG: glycosyltransferase [Pelolinea sp.]|nr:glycosyltransferase [Pelolinea sp.]
MICTYNRHEMLDMALKALINGTEEKPDQIIIVNGGDERADRVVKKYIESNELDIQLVKTVNVNLATSRNIGLAHCTGDIVAMTDDDAEVFPDWVTRMKRVHAEHPEAGAAGGAVIGADSGKSLLSRISDVATFPSLAEPAYVRTIPGVNVSYKREVLQKVGVQDETLFRGEDVDFNWRVKKMDYEIYYDPRIKVIHHHRPTLKGLMNQFYMYGRAYYLVRNKWPEMYSVYPLKINGMHDLLKFVYFLLSSLFEPTQVLKKLSTSKDKFLSLPVVYLTHFSWKTGIIQQALISKQKITC